MRSSRDLLAHLKTLHPMMIDLSLGRIENLLAKLGHPERRLAPVVHIAGTNGKGSTTAFLRAMLEAAGKRVHVYTSPHLVHFHERIVVAGADGISRQIAEGHLVDVLERTAAANAGEPMTFFEMTTAAAFLAFAETPADAVLLEVGLGGRLDATNVIERPALTIITPVSIDHADKLGNTVAKIAGEKAGILKRGVPCVVAEQSDDALSVIEARARGLAVPLDVANRDWRAFTQSGRLVFETEERVLDLPLPALIGPHQVSNAGTAIAAALRLKAPGIEEPAIARGLITVKWPARMQRLGNGVLADRLGDRHELWLDGGHNPAGGQALAATLGELEERAPKPLILVLGMMGQKDAAGFLAPFNGLVRRILPVPIPGAHEAPLTPEVLAARAAALGFAVQAEQSVEAALDRIRAQERAACRVVICGSLYLASRVLALQDGATPDSN
jgi:dihydrofolate synthase/folylpolyglutamate synthase